MPDAFGLPDQQDQEQLDFLQPETEAQPQPEAPTPEAQPEETPQERLFANKYRSVEELEKGYQELLKLHNRTARSAREYEQRYAILEQQARALESALQQALPLMQRAVQPRVVTPPPQPRAEEPPPLGWEQPQPQQPPRPVFVGPTPAEVQQYAEAMAQQRIAAQQAAAAQDADRMIFAQEAQEAIMKFYEDHPDVRGEADAEMARTILELNAAWEDQDWVLDISDPEALEIAYEASQWPALREVLKLNPSLVDTDEGMELARAQAEALDARLGTQQKETPEETQPQPRPSAGPQRKPFVEPASGVKPSGGKETLDEFDQAVLEYRKAKKGSLAGTVFE